MEVGGGAGTGQRKRGRRRGGRRWHGLSIGALASAVVRSRSGRPQGQTHLPGIRQFWNTHTVHAVEVLPGEGVDGGLAVASGASDKTVRLWDPDTGQLMKSLCSHVGGVLSLAKLPGRRLASGSEDKTVRFEAAAQLKLCSQMGGDIVAVSFARLSPFVYRLKP